ncbi:hypothetical protein AFR_39450 [Actinoplanes friuliensis DSM 7358]|uniref:DUF4349 domain-containing protein n=1 Tax=Actinoplanes friuliensis DSM 7358 TaxID=1246995 RepID=U5WAJ6_9ACTN|nr:hypothetical protein AFR_39450 [Actinoplanes friuliensis DSM 7358]
MTLALAGCGDSSDTQSSSGSTADRAGPAAEAPAAGGADEADSNAGAAPEQGKDQAAQAPDLAVDQRSIIYTGSITVRVDDVNIAAARASGIATAAGGFIGGDKRNSNSGSSDATLELRVPADKFSSAVDQLAKLGTEENRGINTEDVTEQTIDLDARIATQTARVDSGRKLLGQAKSLSDLVMLEREVATRESDLASLQAKKRRLADLTSLSTITVILLDPQAAAAQEEESAPGFLSGLENGWKGLLASLGVLLTVIGWLLPWLLAIGLPAWAILWAYRRYRATRPVRPIPPIPAYATPHPGFPPYPPQPAPQSAPPASRSAPQSAPPAQQSAPPATRSAPQSTPPSQQSAPPAPPPAPSAGPDQKASE